MRLDFSQKGNVKLLFSSIEENLYLHSKDFLFLYTYQPYRFLLVLTDVYLFENFYFYI